jgi:signal transduction histidine kinase
MKRLVNTYTVFVFSALLIVFIGFLDEVSGPETSFSIFYLIPIALLALYKDTQKTAIVVNSIFAAIVWLLADLFANHHYSYFLIPYWNSLVRLGIFAIVGLLLYSLKNKNKDLAETNKKLSDLNEEKNKYLGIAAHDLRNPIGGIYSLSDVLLTEKDSPLNSEMKEIVELIHRLSESTLDLLRELLDVSKIEAGKVDLNLTRQGYVSYLRENIRINQLLAQKKDIAIHLEAPEHEIPVQFDRHYLNEVINNLLTNAIKYSHPATAITVKVLYANGQVRTEVTDAGVGIPQEEQRNLFTLFQKTSAQTTAGETSTGLGLAIAKKIVNLHRGEIGVTSEKDKGSTFYFTLPA